MRAGRGNGAILVTAELIDRLRGRQRPEEKPLETEPPAEEDGGQIIIPQLWGGFSGFMVRTNEEEEKQKRLDQLVQPIKELIKTTKDMKEQIAIEAVSENERIQKLATELHNREYRAPSRPAPCFAEREQCTQCYRDYSNDPLKCSKLVEAFQACAKTAKENFIHRTSSAPTN